MADLKNRRISRKEKTAGKLRNFLLLFTIATCSGIVFSIAASSCWYLVSSLETLKIKHINIHGISVVDAGDILAGSSIVKGNHIFKINLAEESRRFEQNPWIYRAVVNRRLPDIIDITVIERTAAALVELDDYYLLDTRGNIFKKADSSSLPVPLIRGIDKNSLKNKPEVFFKTVNAAISLITEVNAAGIFPDRNFMVEAGNPLGLSIVCEDKNIRAFFGWNSYDKKVVFLQKIINDLEKKGQAAKSINISSHQKAYVTL